MKGRAKPFTVEVTSRSVTFTFFEPVPGAAYLQPAEYFRIPVANWREIVASGGPAAGQVTLCNFTTDQVRAHGVDPGGGG